MRDFQEELANAHGEIDRLNARVERLEAALREIAERTSPLNGAGEIARAALAKETDDGRIIQKTAVGGGTRDE